MALNVWTKNSGYSFGIFPEREITDISLPVTNDTGTSYSIISGSLPKGLRISGNHIVGTPFEVARVTESVFCIRASKNNEISDRTFKISITGPDAPIFTTPAGDLAIGSNNQYFVLDSTYVDFQLEATDFDTAVGQTLSYFIADNNGELPPGLVLTGDGRIVGFVKPVLSIKPQDGNGYYDTGAYDAVAFDFGFRKTNGYDSFIFDTTIYDYSVESQVPRKLNRNYEFIVSVSDGDTIATRKFKIFVVGDDYFRADNESLTDDTGLFTADATYLRAPIWLTPSNLGTYRANNYVTVMLDTYDTENVIYSFEYVNSEVLATSKQLTVTDNVVESYSLTIYNALTEPQVGYYVSFSGVVNGGTDELHYITHVDKISNETYRLTLYTKLEVTIPDESVFLIGTKSKLPPGMSFNQETAEIFGRVPYQPAITTTYNFTVTAKRVSLTNEIARSSRKFTINLIGEVDSVITWNTDSNLGTINANFISTLCVNATSTIPNAIVLYTVVNGRLPPGLSLTLDGEIVGKVTQYGDPVVYYSTWQPNTEYPLTAVVLHNGELYKRLVLYTTSESTFNTNKWTPYTFVVPGMTSFSDGAYTNQSFDNGTTTIDRVFNFTVRARDQYGLSAITKDFSITIETPNQITFSNIKVKPYLKLDQRAYWKNFINDSAIFTPNSIYRPNDLNFGIQSELSMLIYAGIETTQAAAYVGAIGLNHKKKRFQFGSVKKAVAMKPGTRTEVYEVVYIEMIDTSDMRNKHLPNKIISDGLQNNKISVDSSNSIWQSGFSHGFNADGNPVAGNEDIINILNTPAPELNRPEPIITIDSTGYISSDPNVKTYYPNTIYNWRQRISQTTASFDNDNNPVAGSSERNYLPLWMRSIQPGDNQELDFVLCVPLCYCKVGTADDIILNIKFSGFDFKTLDYTVDRYIIDAVTGSTGDKYLVFKNDRITV